MGYVVFSAPVTAGHGIRFEKGVVVFIFRNFPIEKLNELAIAFDKISFLEGIAQ